MKVKSFSENDNLELVKQNGDLIRFISSPTEEMCIVALKQNPKCIKYIQNPTEEMIFLSKQVKEQKRQEKVADIQHKIEMTFSPY